MNEITQLLHIDPLLLQALREDIPEEDVSTNAVMPNACPGTVDLIAKEDGIVAGLAVYARVFTLLDPGAKVEFFCRDGDTVQPGQKLAVVTGDIRALLSGERVALNYLQRMSGIATYTHQLSALLEGTGITLLTDSQGKKMGKTAGNAVWLDPNKTSPFEFYQYWRNVGDADVMKCIRMLTFLPLEQIDEMSTWKDERLNEAKEILAYELTKMVHGEEEAVKAQNAARALFSGEADTEHMPTTQLTDADLKDGSIGILTLMVKAGLAASNGEARRLVTQGGVLVDGEKVSAPTASFTAEQLAKGIVIKKGKKVYHKVTL